MTIPELIEVAKEKDPKFKKQIEHRLNKRQKAPEFDWLMGRLESILGKSFLRQAAYDELKKKQEELVKSSEPTANTEEVV